MCVCTGGGVLRLMEPVTPWRRRTPDQGSIPVESDTPLAIGLRMGSHAGFRGRECDMDPDHLYRVLNSRPLPAVIGNNINPPWVRTSLHV